MQCKDIPDRPIVEFIASLNGRWGTWYGYLDESGQLPDNSVRRAMPEPDGIELPAKLVLAKMAMLIRRGLIDGCPCGCRGDYEITEKGSAFIAERIESP